MSRLTTTEAAKILGVTRGRVHQLIAEGLIYADKLGRDYLLDAGDVERAKNRPDRRGRPPGAKNKPKAVRKPKR